MEKRTWSSPELVIYDTVVEVTGQDIEKCGSNVDDWQPIPDQTLLGEFVPDEDCILVG